jgi:shikimate kinase
MRIALIGMSGAGKSFWSTILRRHGFEAFGCDDHIGQRLAAEGEIATPSLDHLGRWMGFPYESDYARREAHYLSTERAVMEALLADLEAEPSGRDSGRDLVLDTTGSVVYTGDTIMERLRRQTVVIYLSLPAAHRDTLRRAYQARPRPVIWQNHFRPREGETDRDAVKRCYPDLLQTRDRLYRRYAHIEIRWEPSFGKRPDVATLLSPAAAFLDQKRSAHDG